jgi:chemotaxis methyl-accepting protein methylase
VGTFQTVSTLTSTRWMGYLQLVFSKALTWPILTAGLNCTFPTNKARSLILIFCRNFYIYFITFLRISFGFRNLFCFRLLV